LQQDAHLMQQDLLSVNVVNLNEESDEALPWHKSLKERFSSLTSRLGVSSPGAMDIMTPSIQVLENRLKRNRLAVDQPDILFKP
ncbi:patatin family protein, partial [Salmonella enterica subsp. enterica serovar Kentucky]